MRARWWSLVLLIACLGADGVLRAEDPPRPSRPPAAREVAERALRAFDAKEQAALEELARARLPSAWVVGDLLVRKGRHDVAVAFARASRHEDLDALLAYLDQERALEPDAPAHAAVEAADAAFARRDMEGVLKALEGITGRGVVGVFVANGRGLALGQLKRWAEAEAVMVAAADHAERMGWRDAVAQTLARARAAAEERGDRGASAAILTRGLALARSRGRASEVAALTIDLGSALNAIGDLEGAEARFREGVELARAAGEKQYEANALTNLGMLLASARRIEEAEPLLEAGLKLHVELGHKAYAALARGGLADVRRARGDVAGAVALYEEAVAQLGSAGDAKALGGTLRNLAKLHAQRGAPVEAEAAARRALDVASKARSDVAKVDALLCLAYVERLTDRREEALRHAQEAYDLALGLGYPGGAVRAALELATGELALNDLESTVKHARASATAAQAAGEEGVRIAAQSVLACALARIGDTDQALALLAETSAWLAKHGSPSDQARAEANRGFVHTVRGEYGPALEHTLAAKKLFARQGDLIGVAETLGNLGNLYFGLGEVDRALAALEESRRRMQDAPDVGARAAAEINLGAAQCSMLTDRPEVARATLERGLALAIEAKNALWQVNAHVNLADLDRSALRIEQAEQHLAKAVRLATDLGARGSLARVHVNWANLLLRANRAPEALAHAEEAVAASEGSGAPELRFRALLERAEARTLLGQDGEALADLRGGAEWLARATRGLSAASGDAGDVWLRVLDLGVGIALRKGDVEALFESIERARAGRLLEGLGGRDALRVGAVPPDLIEAERAAQAAVQSARSHLERVDRAGLKAARAALEAAEMGLGEVVELIQTGSRTAAAAAYPRAATPSEVRATLAPGEAWVAYALTRTEAVAVVLTSTEARIVRLAAAAALEEVVEALIGDSMGEVAESAFEAAHKALVAPLALPDSIRRVSLSPHGPLCFVPFQALLGERTVSYSPSATTRVLLAAHPSVGARGVLALGDPDYGARTLAPEGVATRGRPLARLPGTREEARAVGDVVLLGKDATEGGLARALRERPRWLAVHLACHGLVDAERSMRSALAVSPDAGSDGYMSVLEVYRLRVPADLVVLSACESGRGQLSRSEGVVGFSSAFLLAGADRVISSLWKVDDDATRALMTKFYELWNPKGDAEPLPAPEALRRAQEHVRAQPAWKHPRYWAAWQLWGRSD